MKINKKSKVLSLALLGLSLGFLVQTANAQSSLPGSSGAAIASNDTPSPEDLNNRYASDAEDAPDAKNSEAKADPLSNSSSDSALGETDVISVDFPNEEIRTILRNVADLYMLNLVVPETLQGTASIKLRDVNWRQIFSVVLEPVGYTFLEETNIIKVISIDTLNFEPPVTDIYMLDYADANSIASTLKNMVDAEKGGRVQVDNRTNGLIVTAQQSQMSGIAAVIKRLDKPTQQVLIETRFIEVTNNDVSKIGVNWANLGSYGVRYEGATGEDGKIEVDGVNPIVTGNVRTKLVDLLNGQTVSDFSTKVSSAVFSADQFGLVISALDTLNDSKLVSNPTVVTLNNQEAMISIGEQFPIPNYSYNDERGSFEVSGFEYKDIGVILKVKPSVNNSGLITLTVEPEVSSKTGVVNFGGDNSAEIPIISTRRTNTQIALKDGYTMGLGGLMQNEEVNNNNAVPVASRIPVLGKLFKHKSAEDKKLNLLIFITARILPSENTDFEDVFAKERMSNAGIDLDEMRNQ